MSTPPTSDETIFASALARPPAERAAFLDGACTGDAVRRERIEALLRAHDEAERNFMPTAASAQRVVEPAAGEMIGRYKLLQKIGEGGCGVVYMAEQQEPVVRRVALKIIKLGMDTKEVIARFEAERQALALMDHPNIARVFDGGATESGRPFFVMELVRGIPITKYCDEQNLPTAARLELFTQVCHAVQHAHQKGIIHRDLKPSNILVTLHDGKPVPKVIDFGIAKATQGRLTDATLFTAFEQFIGTPAYMSPEQAEMSGLDIDTRSDIYSLGVLLYELLTGRQPFDAKSLLNAGLDEIRRIIREVDPPRPSTRLSTLTDLDRATITKQHGLAPAQLSTLLRGDLDWIVMRCLEKDRTRRYETANGLAADIGRYLGNEPVTARPPSTLYRLKKWTRRNRLVFASASIVIAALAIGFGVSTRSYFSERTARALAEVQRQAATEARTAEAGERQRAEASAREAATNELRARRLLYASDMNLAQQALKANNLGRARRLLERHLPAPGSNSPDLRGWEWRYLWQQCRSDAVAVLTHRDRGTFSVSLSPDGRHLAVGYLDLRVELWDVPNRRLAKILYEVAEPLIGVSPGQVAFSPRSDLLAATTGSGTVKLHDLAAARETIVCKVAGWIRELAFSADGELLLVIAVEQTGSSLSGWSVKVIDARDGRQVSSKTWATPIGLPFNNVRISPDHQRLYLGHFVRGAPRVQCLRLADWQVIWESEAFTDYGLTAMDLSPDGRFLATGTGFEDSTIRIWNAETGQPTGRLEGHTGWINRLTFSSDGRALASASADQTVRIWDTATWKESTTLRGHGSEVRSVGFSADGRSLASSSKDGEVMLWNTDAGSRKPAGGRESLPTNLKYMSALPGVQAVVAVKANAISVFDLAARKETPLPFKLSEIHSIVPPNFFGTYDGKAKFKFYEIMSSGTRLLAELSVGENLGRSMAFNSERQLLAWTDASPGIHVTSLKQPEKRIELSSKEGDRPLQFGGEVRFLVSSGTNRVGKAWDLNTGQSIEIPDPPGEFGPTTISKTGSTLVSLVADAPENGVVIRNLLQPGQPPGRFPQRGILTGVAITLEGKTFAVSSATGSVVVYDATNQAKPVMLHGHLQGCHGVAFSPDGIRLVSTSAGKEAVKLWDVLTGQELLTLSGEGSLLGNAGFTEDGNTLLVGSLANPGLLQYWRAPSWKEIEEVERNGGAWSRLEKK